MSQRPSLNPDQVKALGAWIDYLKQCHAEEEALVRQAQKETEAVVSQTTASEQGQQDISRLPGVYPKKATAVRGSKR